MEIIHPLADQYCEKFSSAHEVLLQEILDNTTASHPHAHMLSGTVQGDFLQMISYMVKPLRVLEIGTFTGFSALCLAVGMPANGQLHSIELREEDAETARQYFKRSKYNNNISLHVGNALTIVPQLEENWDLVFIDADKLSYIDYYELTLPKLNTGGFIIADNTLFHGQVFAENISGKNAKAIHEFNQHIAADNRTEQVLLSIRDGITLIRKVYI